MQFLEVVSIIRKNLKKLQANTIEKINDINTDTAELEGEVKKEILNEITILK